MDGLKINGVTLFLGHIPGRRGLCFYFVKDGELWPVAYVSKQNEEIATKMWNEMHGGNTATRI